jgi:hypothetical protein
MNVILMIVTVTVLVTANTPPTSNVEFHPMPSMKACLEAESILINDARQTREIIQERFNSPATQRAIPGSGQVTAWPPAFPPTFWRSTRCIEG